MNQRSDQQVLASVYERLATVPEFEGVTDWDVDTRSRLGNTPLHLAAIWGDLEAVECLLRHGANVHAVGEDGYKPLDETREQGHRAVAELLLAHGASSGLAQ